MILNNVKLGRSVAFIKEIFFDRRFDERHVAKGGEGGGLLPFPT